MLQHLPERRYRSPETRNGIDAALNIAGFVLKLECCAEMELMPVACAVYASYMFLVDPKLRTMAVSAFRLLASWSLSTLPVAISSVQCHDGYERHFTRPTFDWIFIRIYY